MTTWCIGRGRVKDLQAFLPNAMLSLLEHKCLSIQKLRAQNMIAVIQRISSGARKPISLSPFAATVAFKRRLPTMLTPANSNISTMSADARNRRRRFAFTVKTVSSATSQIKCSQGKARAVSTQAMAEPDGLEAIAWPGRNKKVHRSANLRHIDIRVLRPILAAKPRQNPRKDPAIIKVRNAQCVVRYMNHPQALPNSTANRR